MATVLIVEDEVMVLILAESVIQSAGYETISAGTLPEAVSLIEATDKKIDLVVTDLTLLDELDGGIEVGRTVEKHFPGIPVVYATARPLTDGLQVLFVQPSAYLPKPYTDTQIIEAIESLLQPVGQPS